MAEREDTIERIERVLKLTHKESITVTIPRLTAERAVSLLKEQEAREPHYTTLRYLVNGMEVAVHHPECPRCIENGLVLWDAEIEKGQVYCKRCGQAVKWE